MTLGAIYHLTGKMSRVFGFFLEKSRKKIPGEAFLQCINKIFDDPEVAEEQRLMAKDIADSTDVEELPW